MPWAWSQFTSENETPQETKRLWSWSHELLRLVTPALRWPAAQPHQDETAESTCVSLGFPGWQALWELPERSLRVRPCLNCWTRYSRQSPFDFIL